MIEKISETMPPESHMVSDVDTSATPDAKHFVLIFAYHYPPENAIGGARPFRFAKYLSRLGYTCRVFTAADQSGRDDPNTEYVPDPFVTRSRHTLSWQLERAVRKFFLPGEVGMHWSYQAARAARAFIRAHPGARITIFSTFPPLGAHLAGWQLARHNRLAWIADCRDPLTDDYKRQHQTSSQRGVYRWLEGVVVRRADAVIANTDAALVQWREKFPSFSKQFHLIWNGFDPDERIKPLPVLSRDCKVLSHVGALYHGRIATPILQSIARLIAANRLLAGSVLVRLIGPALSDCIPDPEFIQRAKSQGWLELVNETIPQREARQVARTSHGLLLLQPQSTTQVPGKLFEYLQIGRPILAFVQPDSPSERLLKRSGVPYRCVYPSSDSEAIDDAVAGFFDLPSTPVAPGAGFEERFNAQNQTWTLHTLVQSLHSAAKSPMGRTMKTPQIADSDSRETPPFRHYAWKQRLICSISLYLFDTTTYTVRHGLLKGMKRKGGLGWLPARLSPGTMTAEQQFWNGLNLRGMTVYDIGAFHGLLTLFFASRAKAVVCFEPNTQNHKRLMENLMLNGIKNVEVRKAGVGSRHETRRMVGSPLMSGGASVDDKAVEELLRARVKTSAEDISIVALDEEIPQAGLPAPDFVKIDIEGWEFEALRGARNTLESCKPALFLEMHGETIREKKRKVADIVDLLWQMNYRRIRHIETGAPITPANASLAMEGHLYCQTI